MTGTNDGSLRRVKLAFERDFTQIPNEWLRHSQLSLGARGLLSMLMSHQEGYVVSVKSLSAQNPEGREAIAAMVRELRAHGYLQTQQLRGRNGRLSGVLWELTDPRDIQRVRESQPPLTGLPHTVKPDAVQPDAVNPHLKEQQLKEHLNQDLTRNPGTGAGANEDASGDAARSPAESDESRRQRIVHQRCPFMPSKEHDFPSGKCSWCGIDSTQRWHKGDIVPLDELLESVVS